MFCWSSSLAVICVLAIRKNRTSYDFGDTSTIDKRKLFIFNFFLNILVSWEREMGIGTANQSRVNNPAGQWEPGGKDATLMLTPPPPIESCLEGQGGEVAERGEGRGRIAGKTGPGEGSPEKDLIGSRREHSC